MSKVIPALAATIIAGALALSGASVASALPVTPITPGGTSSSTTATPPTNTSALALPSTADLKAFASSGPSSTVKSSVPLTVKPTSSSSPTAVPSALFTASSHAASPSKASPTSKPITVEVPTLVLWEKPATTFGPQHLIATKNTADLNALDADAMPGRCYQADLYHESDITGALLEGGVLYAPNNPLEDRISGGDGVSYKTWCVSAPTPVIPTPLTGVTGSITIDCTVKTVTTTTVTTTSNLFHLDGKVLVADKNIVITKTTSRPATAVECPVVVTPPVATPPVVVTPPAVVTPVVAATVVPVHKALAFTGATPLAEATQLALLLAGIIFLGAGIPMTIALRKRARRE